MADAVDEALVDLGPTVAIDDDHLVGDVQERVLGGLVLRVEAGDVAVVGEQSRLDRGPGRVAGLLVRGPEEAVEPLGRRVRGAERRRRQVEGEGGRARQGIGVRSVGQLGRRSAAPRALQASTAASGSGASARGTSVRVCSLDSTGPADIVLLPELAAAGEGARGDGGQQQHGAGGSERFPRAPSTWIGGGRRVRVGGGGRRCSWVKPALVGRPGQGEESPGRTVLTSARGRLRQSFRHAGSEEAEEAPSDRSRAGTEPISSRN